MELAKLLKSDERILLVDVKPSKYSNVTKDIFSIMSKSGGYWIYVTINKPFSALRDSFIRKKIDMEGIFFIDMASSSGAKKDANCLYLGDPHDLTSVSIAIDQAIGSMKGEKFIVFDSVNTLLNYNNESMVIRFMHSTTAKIRAENVRAVILSVGSMDEKISSQLAQFCDKSVKL
ncbi:MAG TPA: hypothetical protein VJH04_02840 [archaeon]|nr:hypothetical protein [archaeon]